MSVVRQEEGCEGEGVLRCAVFKDLTTEVGGARPFGEDGCHFEIGDVSLWSMPKGRLEMAVVVMLLNEEGATKLTCSLALFRIQPNLGKR